MKEHKKYNAIFLIGLFLLQVVFAVPPTVTRDLPPSAAAGSTFTVHLMMDVDESDLPAVVILTENYPPGWVVSDISVGGIDMGDSVEWVCNSIGECGLEDQDITYWITVPIGVSGMAAFSGTVNIGVGPYPVEGGAEMTITESATTTTKMTTTTIDPAEVIMDEINVVVCTLLTIIWYIAAAIAALMIVMAGMSYMASDDPQEVEKAKNRIVYAVVGLIIVLITCPLVDYIIEGTDITPFEESCQCPGLPAPNTTTTASGTTTTIPITTTLLSACPLCTDPDSTCSDFHGLGICLSPGIGIDDTCGGGCADYCCSIGYTNCCPI